MTQKPRIVRSQAEFCFWCGFKLCHACRKASPEEPAECGGHWNRLCVSASTRDHLYPRRLRRGRPLQIVIACFWCNVSKGQHEEMEWLSFLDRKSYDGLLEEKRIAVMVRLWERTSGTA